VIPLPHSPHTIFHFVITLLCFLLSLSILVFMHMDGVCLFLFSMGNIHVSFALDTRCVFV